MEKLKCHTPDFTDKNVQKLAVLFPNCVTESRDDKGTIKWAIDFDQLRQDLSAHAVESPRERYTLDWPGKREALLAANAPIAKTLRPCRDDSVNFDTTKHLFIEGDNLEVLKLLFKPYFGRVKFIYIDPPYNTGQDFVYPDNYADPLKTYLQITGQVDAEGNLLALDSHNEKLLWRYQMGAPMHGTSPITYMLDGRQHVLVPAGTTLTAWALPN